MTLQPPPPCRRKRLSWTYAQVKLSSSLCFTLPKALRSLLSWGNGIEKRLRKPLTPQPPEGHQFLQSILGTEVPSQADILPTGKTAILDRNPCWWWLFSPAVPFSCTPCCSCMRVCMRKVAGWASNSSLWHTGCWSPGNKKPRTVAVAFCIYLFASTFLEGM